jgi:hypothetical protein
MPKKKLRDILLLLIRSLLLLFLILGFARPVYHAGFLGGADSKPLTLLFLVDVSASMGLQSGSQSGLTAAVRQIEDLTRKLPGESRIGFIAYSDRVESELAPATNRSFFLAQLQSLTVQPRPTDVRPALELAYRLMAQQPDGPKFLVAASDQSRHGFQTLMESGKPVNGFDPGVSLLLWESAAETPNSGIKSVNLALLEEGKVKGSWTPHRFDAQNTPLTWKLELNKKIAAQGVSKDLNPILIEAPMPEGGSTAGSVSLESDALAFDDIYYVAGRIPKGFRLLLVDGASGLAPSESEVFYLRAALEAPRDARLQSLTTIRPDALTPAMLDQNEVVVLANVGRLPAEIQSAVKAWIENGGGLFVSAGSQWANNQTDPLGSVRLGGETRQKSSVKKMETPTGFLSHMADVSSFDWSETDVSRYYQVPLDSSLKPLLVLENGDPLLLEKKSGKGVILYWLSTLDRDGTNFPTKPLYSPLMRELIGALADPNRNSSSLMFEVGDPVKLKLTPSVSCSVLLPNGQTAAGRVGQDGIFHWTQTQLPGLYLVSAGASEKTAFAINIKNRAEEGNLERVALRDLKPLFPGASLSFVSAGEKSGAHVRDRLQGRPLMPLFFILCFILFVIETVVANNIWNLRRAVKSAAILLSVCLFSPPLFAGSGNRFVLGHVQHAGLWDPYPEVPSTILQLVRSMTNIDPVMERKTLTLLDEHLYEVPFLLVKGSERLSFSPEEKKRLKRYLDGGGFVFFDDTLAYSNSPFLNRCGRFCGKFIQTDPWTVWLRNTR